MGGMRRMEACLYVAPGDRTVLERLMANGKTPQKLAVRARIVLLSGRGLGTMAIAKAALSACARMRARDRKPESRVSAMRRGLGSSP